MAKRLGLPSTAPSKDVSDYPLFTSGVSRWLWRIYTQRFTPAGRWFALITAIFAMYGGISLQLQGYVPAAYISIIWTLAALAMLLYRPRARLSAHLPQRICAGETLEVDIDVQQLGRLRGADLI